MTPEPYTVLIVDDEAPLRRVLERLLSREGYRVVSAGSGASGGEPRRDRRGRGSRRGGTAPRPAAQLARIPHARAVEPARPRGTGGRHPRRVGDHADQCGGQGPAQ